MDHADMTAPMPETMSPRERVAGEKARAILNSFHPEWSKDHKGEEALGWFLDNISPALASSGDHAELARLAEAATPGPWSAWIKSQTIQIDTRGGDGRLPAIINWPGFDGNDMSRRENGANARFIAAANPAAVLALIAEVEALRGLLDERDLEVAEDDALIRNLEAQTEDAESRAAEAERKLAEAVKVIRDVDRAARQAASMNDAGYTVTVERTATHIYGITDAFLSSKEAEQ